jgi:hypothetical protein
VKRRQHDGRSAARRPRPPVALAVWLLIVGALTLVPQSVSHRAPELLRLSLCVVCGDRGTADAILNLLLFAPLGILMKVNRRSAARAAGVGLVLSVSIELAQCFIPGRYSNLADVVWNTCGAWAGAMAWSAMMKRIPWSRRDASRLRALSVLWTFLATFGFGWLMAPAPTAGPYWGHLTPSFGDMDHYDGSVVEARFESLPIPDGPFARLSQSSLRDDWRLAVIAVEGAAPSALAPIVSVSDDQDRELILLGAMGNDFVYRERTRARVLRLDQPDLRLRGVMGAATVGDTIRMAAVRLGSKRCLMFNGKWGCPAFTPGRGWSLFLYQQHLSFRIQALLDALWMFLLVLPAGFWSVRVRDLLASALEITILITLAVAATRLAPPGWLEALGAVSGLASGWALRIRFT